MNGIANKDPPVGAIFGVSETMIHMLKGAKSMPGHLPELHPPARYGDLRELEQIFAKALPDMRFEVASLFGKRTPRLTRRESTRTRVKLSRFLHAVRPYLLGLYLGHTLARRRVRVGLSATLAQSNMGSVTRDPLGIA